MSSNAIILEYLSNPVYQTNVTKYETKKQPAAQNDISDKRFYKKRIISLFKNILKGEKCPDDIKVVHDHFISLAIQNFKLLDKRDIIQKEYENITTDNASTVAPSINISNIEEHYKKTHILENADKSIMKEKKINPSLDQFVERKNPISSPIIPPSQKKINLRDPSLKTKGIGKKRK